MKARSRLLAAVMLVGLGLTTAGCPNDTPYVAKDDAGVDAAVDAGTFTEFVIDLVKNHTADDSPPVSYDKFKDLSIPTAPPTTPAPTTAFSNKERS